jgi:hypothetical protein
MRSTLAQTACASLDSPCPSWPKTQAQGQGQARLVDAFAGVRAGAQDRHGDLAEERRLGRLDEMQPEVRAHAGAHDLRRPERGRSLDGDRLLEAEGGGAAQDAADVAGSWRRSRTTLGAFGRSGDAGGSGTRKRMGAGLSSEASPAMAAAGTMATAAAGAASRRSSARSQPASLTIACATGPRPLASQAAHRCSPSMTICPCLR